MSITEKFKNKFGAEIELEFIMEDGEMMVFFGDVEVTDAAKEMLGRDYFKETKRDLSPKSYAKDDNYYYEKWKEKRLEGMV